MGQTGFVGVGTAAPEQALDVVGAMAISGTTVSRFTASSRRAAASS
jgi:hypothetical protein